MFNQLITLSGRGYSQGGLSVLKLVEGDTKIQRNKKLVYIFHFNLWIPPPPNEI